MTALLLTNIVLALAVGFSVLLANPRRQSNRILTTQFILVAAWLGCIQQIVEIDVRGGDSLRWIRANVIIAACFPPLVWLLKESIVKPHAVGRALLLSSLPWLALTILAIGLCFHESFVIPAATAGGVTARGWPYFVYIAIELAAFVAILGDAASRVKRQSGVQRIELQFLVLCLVGIGITALLLNGLGNFLRIRGLKSAFIPIVFVGLTVTAWAITVHRIFNARQILLRVVRHLGAITLLSLCILGIPHLLRDFVAPPADLLIGTVAGGILALWIERKSAAWLRLEGDPPLQEMRATLIATARIDSDFHLIAARFEALLRTWCETPGALLLFNEADGHRSGRVLLARDRSAHATLCALGWSTPESLQRRRVDHDLADLRQFLAQHDLGLVFTVPQGHLDPSFIVALGAKSTGCPFTYPEIERLQKTAELMDNILTRARLTEQAALQARMEHLAMMSRGLAHDLKNLITPVSSFLVHTDARFPPDSPEAEVHAAARRSVRIMSDYVREALFFSERLAPRFELVFPQRLLESVRETLATRARQREVPLVLDGAAAPPFVGDAVLLQRMLANLVANAIDASPPGRPVTLAAEPGPHGRVAFSVADRGSGIAAAHLGRIFDPYFTTKEFGDDVRGFGLGLTIAQKIAQLHRAPISVRSAPDQGTTVRVELPAAQPAATPAAARSRLTQPRLDASPTHPLHSPAP